MQTVELLWWDGCPSVADALAGLRSALVDLGRPATEVTLTEILTDEQAADQGFIGSPTVRVDQVDLLPPPPDEPTGLTCRIYRRRDGRFSPTPDPDDLRDALRAALAQPAEEA